MKELFRQFRRLLAKFWLEINLQLTVVGVTGSYGKTTTVNAIAAALSGKFSVNKTDDNLDTLYNIPITILKTKIWNERLVLEYGVDHLGEMDRHLALAKPNIAVLTGITPVHSDESHLGSLENIIREKRKLITALPQDGLAIFNYDDTEIKQIALSHQGKKITYGFSAKADVWADNIELSVLHTSFVICDGSERIFIKTFLLGFQAVYACLVAYIVAKSQKVATKDIVSKLALLRPLKGRFSVEAGPLGSQLVNDSKRANPASVIAGLKSLAQFPGRKIAVLGEMGELGSSSEEWHRKVGKETAKFNLDILIGIGQATKILIETARKAGLKKCYYAENVQDAATFLRKNLKKDDLLYLKASLLRHVERVVLILNGREVKCQKISCLRYSPCESCDKLVK